MLNFRWVKLLFHILPLSQWGLYTGKICEQIHIRLYMLKIMTTLSKFVVFFLQCDSPVSLSNKNINKELAQSIYIII